MKYFSLRSTNFSTTTHLILHCIALSRAKNDYKIAPPKSFRTPFLLQVDEKGLKVSPKWDLTLIVCWKHGAVLIVFFVKSLKFGDLTILHLKKSNVLKIKGMGWNYVIHIWWKLRSLKYFPPIHNIRIKWTEKRNKLVTSH